MEGLYSTHAAFAQGRPLAVYLWHADIKISAVGVNPV